MRGNAAPLLIDAQQQRLLGAVAFELTIELGHLLGGLDVAGEQNEA